MNNVSNLSLTICFMFVGLTLFILLSVVISDQYPSEYITPYLCIYPGLLVLMWISRAVEDADPHPTGPFNIEEIEYDRIRKSNY